LIQASGPTAIQQLRPRNRPWPPSPGVGTVQGNMSPATSCLLIALLGSIGPWIWIACRKDPTASAWSAPPLVDVDTNDCRRLISQDFQDRLTGRSTWLVILFIFMAVVLHDYVEQKPEYFFTILLSYLLCFLTSSLVILFAWSRVGKPNGVRPGLLAVFFLSGGILGVIFAMIFEVFEESGWNGISRGCNMTHMIATPDCEALAAVMWILTPGLIEETGKALWLFFRFRRSPDQLPSHCCLGIFPASHSYDCGCWYKLAPTPYHVVLSALAAGAGFECLENVKYVFVNTDALERLGAPGGGTLLEIAEMRCLTSGLHMVWTGIIGWGLAQRLFLSEGLRPSLLRVILPSIMLHGMYDYSLSALPAVAKGVKTGVLSEESGNLELDFFLLLLLISSFGSCLLLACFTGLRCWCSEQGCSCCCAPRFWETRFKVHIPPPVVGNIVFAREVQQPLIS